MFRQFYWKVFVSSGAIISLIALFNFMVDPYGFHITHEKIGINQQKEGVRNKIRYVKSVQVIAQAPKTLILGSSRVHDGMNPQSRSIPGGYANVYNYGIPLIRIKEMKLFLAHALQTQKVENVVIGLDFFMFNAKERLNYEFDPALLDKNSQYINRYFNPYFSSSALSDSIDTLKISRKQKDRKEFLSDGYRPGYGVFYGLKSYEKLHSYINWIYLSANEKETLYYQNFALDNEVFADFEEILLMTQKHHIRLFLYFSPAHATLDGEGILVSKNWTNFETLKRKITNIAYDFGVPLWDFSGYNSITTEKVKTPMRNYWDSSHFTEKTGDMILAKILVNEKNMNDLAIPLDFGVKLTPSNIESHLMKIRADREKYYRENYDEVNKLHMMYRKALDGMKQNSLELEGTF
jgi:hypothetical protein